MNGKLHRENFPAIETKGGTKKWYLNGKKHREDGPAIEWADGKKEWFIHGKKFTEKEFKSKSRKKKLKDLLND